MKTTTAPLLTLLLAVAFAPPALAQTKRQADRSPPACLAEKWPLPPAAAGVAYAIDGDTLAVAGLPQHIRIWGIQAAELRKRDAAGATGIETVPGMVARAELETLLEAAGPESERRTVWYEPAKWDRYCRIVAQVFAEPASRDGGRVDLGLALLQRGVAYGYWLDDTIAGKPDLARRYAAAESRARATKAGLWKTWLGD